MGNLETTLPSNRKFGSFFTVIFILFASYFFWNESVILSILFAIFGLLFGMVTIIKAELLLTLNTLWFHIGNLLGKIVSPIVLGVIFFGIFTPIAILFRLFGRDELILKRQQVESYWTIKESHRPINESFKSQF